MTMRFHFGSSRSRTFAALREFLLSFGFFLNVSDVEVTLPDVASLRTPPDWLREASVLHFQKALSINPLFTKAPWSKSGCHQHFSICGVLVST